MTRLSPNSNVEPFNSRYCSKSLH